ncbi:hypothetical protein AVEN_270524-1 [Araneus ventricosus]|uniref:Uncharacterized protein n=1 Tax=Araneus ventricosus TaxID=182803 RepID=A0A4Y2B5D9_ARAVE|nr:hypothetical protein AVEN_270524-1 [Araneus ventricosus]
MINCFVYTTFFPVLKCGNFLISSNVSCDKDIMTSKSFTIDELVEYKLSGANLGDDEKVILPSFEDAMDSPEKLGTHFFCQKNSAKYSMNLIRFIMILKVQRQSAGQSTAKDFN